MRLRQLFEAKETQNIVAVMPGGFHPFHPGHKSLYDWATKTFGKENVYVAATNDTKSRPFPFDVKQKLASMAGVPADRFIQVKSPFSALSYEGIIGNPENTSLIFIRSEKDKSSHPLPDQIRKSDGNMGYLISYKGNGDLETADTHGYMAYGPTIDFDFSGMSIKSASELRASWPEMSEEDKLKAANLMYPGSGETAAKLLDTALGVNEPVAAESFSPMQWLKNALNSDPQFKAWYKMYRADPVKAEKTFRTKHTEYLAQLGEDVSPEESIVENLTSADIPVVQYDRKYGGDVEKVLAVKRNAKADAEALYKKLGGVSHANYEIISKAAEQKKQELRQVYRDALAQKGIKGAAALKSPEYKLFKKQNADMKIMLGTAMRMAVDTSKQSATATGGGITVRND